jgi:glycosyltransferase involved in cell wall biosynthesis
LKKIVHIVNSLDFGGAEKILCDLVLNDKKNYEHEIICLKDSGNRKIVLEKNNIKITFASLNKKKLFFLFKISFLYFNLYKTKPYIIHTWMYHSNLIGAIYAILFGHKKLIWGIFSTKIGLSYNTFTTGIVIRINSIISNFLKIKITSCSIAGYQEHLKYGFNDNFKIIHPGFELINYDNSEIVKFPKEQSSFRIGFLARWDKNKDHNNFFKAIKILQEKKYNFYYYFSGESINLKNKYILNFLSKNGIDFKYIKLLDKSKSISSFFNLINLHVLSSKSEGFPLVVVESMLNGVPNLCTDVGDCREIIKEDGWIVEKSNPHKLAEGIINAYNFLSNKENKNKLLFKMKSRIKDNYSKQKMLQKYINLWGDL